jgi:transcriptional regulator GlxA family with amidase domain
MEKLKVGILIFNEVEVLDFAGPYEVFSLAKMDNEKIFEVFTIGEYTHIIKARNGLKIQPDLSFTNDIHLDILIIPGGYGAEEIEIKNKTLLDWIEKENKKVKILASVCTGAFLLAECGLLNNKSATTHWMNISKFEKDYPLIQVKRNTKFVDEGRIITSAGISAGINMSLHIIRRLYGLETAKTTAKRMEYDIEIE